MKTSRSNEGFALATVLVLILVLTLTIFFSARLTRTDVQVVNNLQNEREAFSIAEAGITEALYRMSIASPSNVTVNGGTFDAAIAPQAGTSWNANLLFSGTSNTLTGTSPNQTLTTPSIQPSTLRLPYSTASAGTNSLAISWETVGGAIRLDPAGREIAKIVSTGTSGSATRKITVWAVKDGGNLSTTGAPSLLTLGTACADNLDVGGGASSVDATGPIQINAGPSPSACAGAISGNGDVTASAINAVGGIQATTTPSGPPGLSTGVLPMDDPLADLGAPCFTNSTPAGCTGSNTTVRSGSEGHPASFSAGATINPGIYYGGITVSATTTMNPGVYIIAGGGFTISTGNTNLSGTGVTIYLTKDPTLTSYAGMSFGNGNVHVDLTAPTSGPLQGILLFQDHNAPDTTIAMQAGNHGSNFNGAIYLPHADVTANGGGNFSIAGNMISKSLSMNGNTNFSFTAPGTIPIFSSPAGVAYSPMAWQDF